MWGKRTKLSLTECRSSLRRARYIFLEHVEGDRCHFVRVADGHGFRSGGTCMDDRRCARIGWGHSRCRREGYLYGGGEVKEQVVQLAAS